MHQASPHPIRPSGWLLLLVVLGLSCTHQQSSVRASRPSPMVAQDLAVAASAPAAETYTTKVSSILLADPLAGMLAVEVDSSTARHGRTPLKRDGRLDRVAYDIGLFTGAANIPASDAVAYLLSHYGLVDPPPNLILIRGGDGAEQSAVGDLRQQLSQIQSAADWRRYGVGVRRTGNAWIGVLAFLEHNVDLEPLSRQLPSRGRTTITGRVRAGFRSPQVLVTVPGGRVRRSPTAVKGEAFTARLECDDGDGPYQVEVNGEDDRGPVVLANFPVYCGVAPPTLFRVSARPPSSSDPAEVERQILSLIDRDRIANGLPPLIRDDRLSRIARDYSREMAGTGEVAHFSRTSGSAVDRARAARLSPFPTVIAENVGRDYSASDAQRGFMSSPGHRDNILSRAVSHVGVGVAAGRREGAAIPLFVTQIFAGWGR